MNSALSRRNSTTCDYDRFHSEHERYREKSRTREILMLVGLFGMMLLALIILPVDELRMLVPLALFLPLWETVSETTFGVAVHSRHCWRGGNLSSTVDSPSCCAIPAEEPPCCAPALESPGTTGPLPPPAVMEKMKLAYEKILASSGKSLLKKYLTRKVFDDLKYKMTTQESTLLDVIQSGAENPDSHIGLYASDPETYRLYASLFDPIIEEYHGFGPRDVHPALDWGDPKSLGDLDPENKYIVSTRVRCGRSLKGFPFAPKMTHDLYHKMEKQTVEALEKLDGVHSGKYTSLKEMQPLQQKQLVDDHYLFKEGDEYLKAAKACEFWPSGRGIFMNENKTFLVWVGEEDHLRIISMQKGGKLDEIYERMAEGVKKIEQNLSFVRHPRLGYVTLCPTNLGTTIRASVMIKLPRIGSKMESLEAVASRYNLQVRGSSGEHTASPDGMYDVSNKRRLGLTEYCAVKEMYDGVAELIKKEQESS